LLIEINFFDVSLEDIRKVWMPDLYDGSQGVSYRSYLKLSKLIKDKVFENIIEDRNYAYKVLLEGYED